MMKMKIINNFKARLKSIIQLKENKRKQKGCNENRMKRTETTHTEIGNMKKKKRKKKKMNKQ